MFTGIRAICFDLDNTLWDVWPTIVRAEHATYAFLTEKFPRIVHRYSIDSLRAERERVQREHPAKQHDFTFIRIATLQACAESVGYSEAVGEQAFEVFIRERNAVQLYADALPALQFLHERYPLFSLTNGNADLRTIGLAHFFAGSYAAREVGALKPDPVMFRHVLKQHELQPNEVLHIGDDPIADVQGARAVGMHTIWLNRARDLWRDEHGASPLTISALDELVALL